MRKIVGLRQFQSKLQDFLDQVLETRQPLILVSDSRPKAVLIPYEDFERFQLLLENERLAEFDEVWARLDELYAAMAEDEIGDDIRNAR